MLSKALNQKEIKDNQPFVWTDDKVIKFLNWYLSKFNIKFTFQNDNMLKAFKEGQNRQISNILDY